MQMYNPSAPVYPQQQGFQPLSVQAAGAPPPTYMPGTVPYQQSYGSSGYPLQQYPMQQYSQQQYSQQYPQQQYSQQQYPQQLPLQYGTPQQYNPQMPYTPQMYNPQAPRGYGSAGYPQTSTLLLATTGMVVAGGCICDQVQRLLQLICCFAGQPHTSGGFNMSSAMMGLAAGAVGGAVLGKHRECTSSVYV